MKLREAEAREPTLQFSLLKGMDYRRRVVVTAVLALAGLVLQIVFLSFWAGLPLLFAAVVCSWVVGFDNKLDKRGFGHDVAWETAPFDRVTTIRKLDRESARWDSSLWDISNPVGGAIFALVLIGIVVAAFVVAAAVGDEAALVVGGDAVLLLLAQWFSGMRSRFRQNDLMVKVDHLLDAVRPARDEIEGELRVQLRMRGRTERRVPTDIKLSVHYADAPEHFLGVQAQIVLNRVQGSAYPYFYAIVVAREGHGLIDDARRVAMPHGVILEDKTEDDVDVAIIRQRTTKTSGYHTRPARSRRILTTALRVADAHLARVST